ncbi:hypothetical protein T4D_1148 [Trichinella pseudospiralis]|uniref:Uncharacterized protein n=1 Tax=Trichinella pseudospiralis TaxID=6337 RepID=A0A0V1FIU3_TRIPS|nr:hypothetical protein T4D_1148 [Trichinella pseudospiralis]
MKKLETAVFKRTNKAGGGSVYVDKHIVESVKKWLCGQVVRRRSRKPKITGSIPVGANTFSID